MSVVAAVRPESWNVPLFLHVLGAMILVGGLFGGATLLGLAGGDARLLRAGYASLPAVALPGWILMRVGGQWIASKEGLDGLPRDVEPTWLSLGGFVADFGGLILALSLVVGGIGVYRLRQDRGAGLLRATLALAIVLLAAYVVAAWAMAGKPD